MKEITRTRPRPRPRGRTTRHEDTSRSIRGQPSLRMMWLFVSPLMVAVSSSAVFPRHSLASPGTTRTRAAVAAFVGPTTACDASCRSSRMGGPVSCARRRTTTTTTSGSSPTRPRPIAPEAIAFAPPTAARTSTTRLPLAAGSAEDDDGAVSPPSRSSAPPAEDGSAAAAAADAAREALLRASRHLDRLDRAYERNNGGSRDDGGDAADADPHGEERDELVRSYMQRAANSLKGELKARRLMQTGRKPDLALRLANDDLALRHPELAAANFLDDTESSGGGGAVVREDALAELAERREMLEREEVEAESHPYREFAGIVDLSAAAGKALKMARFEGPSPIQVEAVPRIAGGESVILHAETGSGKTLAYLLPITEQLWRERSTPSQEVGGHCLILTPTRELAAQVAGVASVLAPPGSVRLVSEPTNLAEVGRDEVDEAGGRRERAGGSQGVGAAAGRIIVGSAKAVMVSLYGDGRMPAPPTPKPLAVQFFKGVRWLVMDEVDRILEVKKGRMAKKKRVKHEKPAAVVGAAVARFTFGRCQFLAASATVGRPLRREFARVLGLPAQECPEVVRAAPAAGSSSRSRESGAVDEVGIQVGRAVTIPSTVRNYVFSTGGSTSGSLLTSAALVSKRLPPRKDGKGRRILLVLTKGCGLRVHNSVGALRHFGAKPEPIAFLDALQADNSDRLIEVHREVSGASGVGASSSLGNDKGYLLVTAEDNVRGLHLDGLDTVLVVGRPDGPDEYSHVAGRTGRMGQDGIVINIVSFEQAAALSSWEQMLRIEFNTLVESEVAALQI